MRSIEDLSIDELYTEAIYVAERLESDDRMNPLSWARYKSLMEYKKKLDAEIARRDNERFK